MRKLVTPLILAIISVISIYRPAGKFTYDNSVSENRVMFQYEIFGCGSIVRKVIDGGGKLTAKFKEEYPDIGTNEIVFTSDSDEPQKIFDAAESQTGGLAEKYTYIIEGEAVGVTEGAPNCCELKPAYNENVVLFKVSDWYFTEYVPYKDIGNPIVTFVSVIVLAVSAAWILMLIWCRVKKKEI